MRRVSVFGSTGSVGRNTVDLLRRREGLEVVALSGGENIALLAEQARMLGARLAVTANPSRLEDLRAALAGSDTQAAAGRAALLEAAAMPTDWAMSAIVGFAGLEVSLALAASTGVLALANKESLVCAGPLLRAACAAHGTTLLPVDSEHSAILQCIAGDRRAVERIILTASGGPFLDASEQEMARATPEQAVSHPNWSMGARISIDSASLFNKAMEVIETKELFDVDNGQIEVVIHPQSIIHSMVGFADGAIMAHLGPPDMRAPIGFALDWPERRPLPVERLDFGRLGTLTFRQPDERRFPALALARQVLEAGGLAGAHLNAAKEVALDRFLARDIGFLDMARLVAHVLEKLDPRGDMTLEAVIAADAAARREANAWRADV